VKLKSEKRTATKNDRLAEVYRTAAQIILQKGYDATSVNDIANALGMTKAGLYHYISGKKELLYDIMIFGLDELKDECVTPAHSIANAGERLRFIITKHAQLVTRGQGAITILVDEMTALTPAQNRKITARKREYFDKLRGTLNELKAEGQLQDVDTTTATFSILGMINWLSRWFRPDGSLTPDQIGEEISKIVLHGLIRPEHCEVRHSLKIVKN
jgi:AcrR family transcriptional regulator